MQYCLASCGDVWESQGSLGSLREFAALELERKAMHKPHSVQDVLCRHIALGTVAIFAWYRRQR